LGHHRKSRPLNGSDHWDLAGYAASFLFAAARLDSRGGCPHMELRL
jgi:hypothetical protein